MIRVVFNLKGGVGKTSLAANLAALHAARGQQTLLVDLDAQGNASQYVQGRENQGSIEFFRDTLALLPGRRAADEFVAPTAHAALSLMGAGAELAALERQLDARYKIYKLRELLQRLQHSHAQIWIDAPPALNFFSISALIAADRVLIPHDCDAFAGQAMQQVMACIDDIRADHNADLLLEGVVINQFQGHTRLHGEAVAALQARGVPVRHTHLPASVKMRESHERSLPLVHMAPRHKLTLALGALLDELDAR